MKDEVKEILQDDGELLVYYKDNSFESFDTLPKNVLNYITNLQEENEEFRLLKERYQLIKEIYKERIDKAIEYIKSPKICIDIRKTDGTLDFVSTDELLNILGDKE